MAVPKSEIINKMLFELDGPIPYGLPEKPFAFCVHASVMENIQMKGPIRHHFDINTEWEIFKFELQIGEKCYDMRLIIVTPGTDEKLQFLLHLITDSQLSFPWEDNLTLFIVEKSFDILQNFIRIHNLQGDILKIEEKPSISAVNEIIKVVTFNRSVNDSFKILADYWHLLSTEIDRPYYYYATYAFPWFHPLWLKHFKIHIDNDVYSVLFVILNHLGTISYANGLNIFDLLMLRLALCDYRSPSPSTLLKYEIDFMIKRELDKIVQNDQLDLDQYTIDHNYEQKHFLINYLVYEFQNFFVNIKTSKNEGFLSNRIHSNIEVAALGTDAVLNKLKEKFNIEFDIDGCGEARMGLSLFLDLVECENVSTIRLDTNNIWPNEVCGLNRIISNSHGKIDVHLIGSNTNNFIEHFVSSLKTISFSKGVIYLHIYCNLIDYSIFDNLIVEWIELYDITVDSHMLEGLEKCNLKSCIIVHSCTFKNTRHNWARFNNSTKIVYAGIHEDEGTWQSMFEFISDELLNSNAKEFRFAHKRVTILCNGDPITLTMYKFTIDDLNSKLQFQNIFTDEIVDMYDLKFEPVPDDKSDYDFYE